jgi:hypothetical protein
MSRLREVPRLTPVHQERTGTAENRRVTGIRLDVITSNQQSLILRGKRGTDCSSASIENLELHSLSCVSQQLSRNIVCVTR